MNQQPDTGEDDGTKSSRDDGRNTSRGSILRDALGIPSPVDREIRCNGDTDESADNGLGGGYGEAEIGADGQPDRGA